MRFKNIFLALLSVMLLSLSITGVSAEDQKINILYVAYSPVEAIEMATQTSVYSEFINYSYIMGYNTSNWGASDELLDAAQNGILENQDIIFCDMLSTKVYGGVNDSLKAAHDNGTSLLSIRSSGTPEYFDYNSNGSINDTICNYYNNLGTVGKGLENAENLLVYLAKEYGNHPEITDDWNNSVSNYNEFLFVLGTDYNKEEVLAVSSNPNISSEINISVITKENIDTEEINFSKYGVIFIESVNETKVQNWTSEIKAAQARGSKVIGYNLSDEITLPNVDLYSDEYTDIERYWIQGNESNIENMVKFMGMVFGEIWESSEIAEPEIILEKINITYILNADSCVHYMNLVIDERSVVSDRFNVKVMVGGDAVNSSINLSNEDVVIFYMVGADEFPQLQDGIVEAKDKGVQIGMFGMLTASYIYTTFDMETLPHSEMQKYLFNGGYENMENWIRCAGATLENTYIEYSSAAEPEIPSNGIYHPDAFPRIFENSTEYLEWYADHGYNESAPTIGIIGSIGKDSIAFNTENTIIRNLESKGYNVIYTTYKVCEDDVDYFTKDGEVLVDSIISLKGFYLNYGNQEEGVEYLEQYNVPVVKGILDYYYAPEEYLASVHGLNPKSLYYQVTHAEIDGCIEYIWVAGRVKDATTGQYYYEPIEDQIDCLCDRSIEWAELGKKENSEKKVSILYYNHEGGKSNIGASYIDVGSSFTLILEQMQDAGYDIGNDTIPDGDEFIELFIESRNVGSWAPGELEKVVDTGYVTLLPAEEYIEWYNTLPESVRTDIEAMWGEAPGNVMTYENASGTYFVIPTVQMGNVNFIPQPTRAWLSNESITYHDTALPPTHQYLATYFWINRVYDADAMIHFGTHGTQEWLPGNEVGLWRYDYPSLCVDDTPVIYPYIVDNVGEGTQAKRRGNAVIIDHLTPVIVEAGLYGELAEMHDKIHMYKDEINKNNTAMATLYRNTITELYMNISMEEDIGVTPEELQNMSEDEFGSFLDLTLHDYLHELQSTLMPLGLHVFGVAPEDYKLISMVKSMLGDTFVDHIYAVIPEEIGDEEDREDLADEYAYDLLNATILNGTDVVTVQTEILNLTNAAITTDLNTGLGYAINLTLTTREISQTLRALNAEYIEPVVGNDPIRNPEVLPTGGNFYSFDQRMFPDEETEDMGVILVNQTLEAYMADHGTYPNKVSYILWSVETMRHHGLMEAQIYAMIGVQPNRTNGRITGFTIIPEEEMTHPRIDVVLIPSGLYRDTFPYQLELMDTAIRMIAELNETNETNYIRANSLKIKQELLENGYDEGTAEYISMSRIFSEAPGTYGTGMCEAASASETWDNESELADLFISRMSNIYGKDMWGEQYEDALKMNLVDVDLAIHSDSTNLYGLVDIDDYYSYLGGLALAVRSLSGETPDLYIADLTSATNPEMGTLSDAFRVELRARYLNPTWIAGMMEYDYAGAREMMKFVEYMWGWDVMTPDMVTDSDWNQIYDVYVVDKYGMDFDQYFSENPYQYQSMTARMLETARKDYWNADDAVLENLANEFIQSVVEYGVTCCHHTCGNLELNDWALAHSSLDEETLKEYEKLYEEATQKDIELPSETETPIESSDSGSDTYSKVYSGNESVIEAVNATNTTIPTNTTFTEDAAPSVGSEGGRSSTSSSSSSSAESSSSSTSKTQKAYEVTVANEPEQTETSGTTIIAIVGAIGMTGLVGVGYFKQNPEVFTNIINALKLLRRK
uniref:Cobaltochelatase n=1 Tax=Methanococcus maripaludis (strain C6 / ATCC BAA-1332) TaxID=444158 RepID=A9A729_METM6